MALLYSLRNEMSVDLPDSIIGEYLNALANALENNEDKKETAILVKRVLNGDYAFGIWMSLAQIDSHHKGIHLIFRGFEPRNFGLFRALTVEELILSVKFYVISWMTLIDMIAGLINKVFDIGLADADVKLELMRRNRHVKNSDLPAIFEKHSNALRMEGMRRDRNDIVHRGKIVDAEVKQFCDAQNVLRAQRYSFLRSNHISEEEYKKENAGQTEILFELASRKKAEYEAHYKATLEMIAEVLNSLGRKAVELQKQKAI
jgi:hypothetical protein